MKQTSFIDDPLLPFQGGPPVRALAKADGPESSKLAAAEVVDSGRAGRNMQRCVDWVYMRPGLTSKQISELPACDLERHEVARRLADAREAGLVESRPGDGKGKELVWFPKGGD